MRILSPAKINLFLRVTGQRADGYHELFTLMSCVGLADTIDLYFETNGIIIRCDHPQVPRDSGNLAYRAAALFFKRSGIPVGVTITIDKKIPVAAGLGGGSSNAAAVLKALNRHFNNPFSPDQLGKMAAGLGADVPFLLYGRPALATGIGDRLVPYPLLRQYPVIIINPGFSVSTAETYKNYCFGLTNDKKNINNHSFIERTAFDAATHLVNDLESVTAARHPEIDRAKQRLLDHGATGALMSGSGPSVFGIFPDAQIAEQAFNSLIGQANERIFLTELLTGEDTAQG